MIEHQDDDDANYCSNNNNELGDDLSVLLEYESGIDYNNKNNNETRSYSSIIQEDAGIIVSLNKLSIDKIDKEEGRAIKDKNSAQKTPESIDSSLTLLALVKARKKERKGIENLLLLHIIILFYLQTYVYIDIEMGVEKVITPVRRSARIHKSSHYDDDFHTPENQKVSMLLEENGLAYVPNPVRKFKILNI